MPIQIPAPFVYGTEPSSIVVDARGGVQELSVPLAVEAGEPPAGREYVFVGPYVVGLTVSGRTRGVTASAGSAISVALAGNSTANDPFFPKETSADWLPFTTTVLGGTSATSPGVWTLEIDLNDGELQVDVVVLHATSVPTMPML